MASMTFLINDSSTGGNVPTVRLVITENADGSVTIDVTQLNGYVGDLRGLFFDIADESLIGTLSVVAAAGLTELQQGNDTIKDLGNGANMQGLLGDGGGYDVGVEFGSAGIGHGDDIRAFSFTLKTSAAGGLDLSDFSNVAFGARITSVGLDSNGDGVFESARSGSAKIGETTFSVISPGNNAVTLAEDEAATAAGTNGNLLANDGAGAGDTLSITGWSAGATSLAPGATFTSAALYGATVTINANGSWTVDAGAADALAAGETVSQTFTYTVLQNNVDGSSTQTASFTVTITGSNDPAVISGQSTAALTETDAAQSIGGDLNATDVDGPATFVAQTGIAGTNGHGSFSIDAAGTWTYTMNNAHDEFVAGQTYTDSVTVATADGTTQVISVTITGSNDAAVLSADVRDLNETNAPLATSGVLTISDVDSPATFVAQAATAGSYGSFSIDAAGAWTYSAGSAHDEFVAGQTYTDTFDVVSADGTHTSVTINILGTNDAAIVSSATQTWPRPMRR